jgi:hypothetical protein
MAGFHPPVNRSFIKQTFGTHLAIDPDKNHGRRGLVIG